MRWHRAAEHRQSPSVFVVLRALHRQIERGFVLAALIGAVHHIDIGSFGPGAGVTVAAGATGVAAGFGVAAAAGFWPLRAAWLSASQPAC